MMKRKILYIGAVVIISLTSFVIGRNSVENVPEQAQETVAEVPETYIDTEEIESGKNGIGRDMMENFYNKHQIQLINITQRKRQIELISVERSGTKQKERSHDYDNSRKIFSRLYV